MTSIAPTLDADLFDEPVATGGPDADAREIARILADSKLAYVAIGTARGPLVTPVLYGTSSGALWVLTNRNALKAKVWRKRPRAGWTVRSGTSAVSFTGEATLLSARDARAILARPLGLVAVPPAVLSWVCRNPRQVAGFVRDAIAHPTRGMPQDFVLVRLQPDSATVVRDIEPGQDATATADSRMAAAGIPANLGQLAALSSGVLGLATADGPVAFPVGWDPATSVVRVPREVSRLAVDDEAPACVTFDEPVHLRPTEQRGIVLRGTARRASDNGRLLTLDPTRVTYWDGFVVQTVDIEA